MSKGQIVFFDATEVRREKMRNAAMGVKEQKVVSHNVEFVNKNIAPPIVEPAPKAEVKAEKPEVKIEKPAAAAPAVAISKDELESALVAFVVEQTGYPEDMVEMDADLEGDLGIDSIKKAQLMGELNEKYHFVDVSSAADSDMSLDDFPTLGSIRDYLLGKAGEAGTAPVEKKEVKPEPKEEAAPAPAPSPAPLATCNSQLVTISKEELESALINFVVEQTGYPEDMVEMDADLEGDLGIDSIKKAQLMGELNEKYHFVDVSAAADSDMSLDDFPTLGSIRDYLLSKSTGTVETGLEGGNETTSGSEVTLPKTESAPAPASLATSNSQLTTINKKELESALVNFVVEQTGYPEDMVEMDADLEGDLGIDSIKKAQLMGELNEKYHFVDVSAAADSDMSLDDFPTLGSIRDYLLSKASGTGLEGGNETTSGSEVTLPQSEPSVKAAVASTPKSSAFKEELSAFLINFVVEQTGYPQEMVEMDIDLEGDLGIDSIKKAQLFGELSEKYELVPLGDMSLDDFKTLRDIYNAILQCAR